MSQHFDLICIGGGSGGIATANRAAQRGAKVAVVEANRLGGTCVNVGCVPKKVMWYAAATAEAIHDAADFGFDVELKGFDWGALVERRDAYIKRLNGLYAKGLEGNGVTHIEGFARFADAQTIEVESDRGTEQYSADRFVIATGGQPVWPELPGAEHGITSDGFFELKTQPRKALVVGAGYIAVELAGVLNALGTETTLAVRGDRPLRQFDRDLGDALVRGMAEHNLEVRTGSEVEKVERQSDGTLAVTFKDGGTLDGVDSLIWAIGRRANTADLNLSAAGVEVLGNGKISSNEWEQTNVDHIYALGDINGKAELTPVAIAAGRRMADRIFGGMKGRKLDYRLIPTVMFSHPPIGTIGLSEADAREQYGDAVTVYKSSFNPMSHAFSDIKPPTMVKLIVAGEEETVVGLHAIGPGVDEMTQGFAIPMSMGATKADFDNTIPIHPTLAEELVTLK
ncbi:glutathione-disulfide reductase [gamma proteobacterium HTCC5015]|nr:glutathione-disulfide reductase [gamma proteobacterium HTCC5015]